MQATSLCEPGVSGFVATPDPNNGFQALIKPITYLVKIIRPSDFTVLAQGNVTIQP